MNLEIQVANDNALHWQKAHREMTKRHKTVRNKSGVYADLLRQVQHLVNQNTVDPRTPTIAAELGSLLETIRKQLEKDNESEQS